MLIAGIMTLSRGPYNELDKMSLFQDLKLKRRKVDSRCSSDGESLADTSTSSPDLPPLSPKMCDASLQQGNTNQTSISSHQSQTTSNSPPTPSSSPPETISSEDHEATITTLTSTKRDSSINDGQHENPSTTTNDHNPHAHNGSAGHCNNSSSGISVIMENRPRSHSPAPSSPIRRTQVNTLLQQTLTQSLIPSSESNSHQQQHVTVLVTPPRIKTETHHLMNAMTRKLPPVSNISSIDTHSLPITAPMSGLSQLQHHHQINQVQIPFTSAPSTTAIASGFKRNIAGQISPPNHMHQHHHHHPYPIDVQQRIKRERSPNSHLTIIPQPNNQMRQQQLSPHQIPISSAAAAVFHGTPLQMRGAQGLREATMLFRIKNESQMAMPPGFMPSTHPQRMMWGPQARINGVKPEVIGGPLPPLRQQVSPQSSPQQQTSPKHNSNSNKARSTPTVIMGESCGVRTMVWGFEPVMSQNQQQQQPQVQNLNSPVQSPPGTSQSSNHSTSSNLSSNNEEAAHLLLSLGQGVRPIIEVSREFTFSSICPQK
jgi:nuclear receptor subfamily 6 group A